jgi:uncharacterized membrane protein YphA (DoxX/SURF4 family)
MSNNFQPDAAKRIPALVVVARVLLGSVFLFSAADKALHFSQAVGEVQALGLPAPAVVALSVIVVQAVGVLLLWFQRVAWLGAGLLAVFTLAATVLAHQFWQESGHAYVRELTTFLEHLAIIGGLMLAGMRNDGER